MPAPSRSATVDLQADRKLRALRTAALDRSAPGTTARRIRWAAGETEVLALGEGPPLVLVHGGLGQAIDWLPILAELSRTFRVYAVDRPGHGLADAHDYRDTDVLEHAVSFLDGVWAGLGLERAALVGNSMGGRWAIEYALRRPDSVSWLALPGLPAGIVRELPSEFYRARTALRMMGRPVLGAVVRWAMAKPSSRERGREEMRGLVAHPERISVELLDCGTFNFLRNRRSLLSLIERATDERGMVPQLVLGDRWRELRVSTTFLWGESDAFGPPDLGREAASRAPNGRFVLIPDAGHVPWLDQPDRVAAEISAAAPRG